MTRILTGAIIVLLALCLFQWRVLRELKAELAAVDARAREAALVDLHDRRDEVLRTMTWIDVTSRAGGARDPQDGICRDNAPNVDRIGQWLFDAYLLDRAKGSTEIEARQRLFEVIRAGTR